MALDQALLGHAERAGLATLRLYAWEPATLSFGRNEPATRRYDRAAIERLGMPTVRRPTGGRAVWHADEVTYAVAAPIDAFGTLAQSYQRIHETLAHALTALGFPAALAPQPARGSALDAGACFASPAGGEVMLPGGKVVVYTKGRIPDSSQYYYSTDNDEHPAFPVIVLDDGEVIVGFNKARLEEKSVKAESE